MAVGDIRNSETCAIGGLHSVIKNHRQHFSQARFGLRCGMPFLPPNRQRQSTEGGCRNYQIQTSEVHHISYDRLRCII